MTEVAGINKKTIRQSMRQARRELNPTERHAASRRLSRVAAASGIVRGARHIALYASNDGEIDVSEFADTLRTCGAACYVPVIVGRRGWRDLSFARMDYDTPIRFNRYGIAEPDTPVREFRRSVQLDLIFLPLVAFDNDGNRIGMGGGYYDRTLAWRRRRRVWSGTRLIGVAYQFQQFDKLPIQSWDIPIDGILTDQQYRSL